MNNSRIFILLGLLTIASCQQSKPLSAKERSLIVDSIRQTLVSYYSDIRKEGLTAEFKYLDNSADFFWVPPGYSNPLSYDSVSSILKRSAPAFRSVDNSFDSLRIVPLTREVATYTGVVKSIMIDTVGQTIELKLIETGIVIKRKDGWKLLSGQTTVLDK